MTTLAPGYVQSRVYMDTIVTIQVPDAAGDVAARVEHAFGWFAEVERRCSRFEPDSELSRLCRRAGEPVAVSPLLFRAIEFSLAVAEASDGAFDPTIGAAMERRGFNRSYRTGASTPHPAAAVATWRDVLLDPAHLRVTLLRPLRLDLGAVAKGLAIDLAARELADIPNVMINAGGDVFVRGHSPDGEPWCVGIKHPGDPSRLIAGLSLTHGAVCTSGGYERPAPAAVGHHILSPVTGASPCDVDAVTVVAESAMVADALSTAIFVLGCEAGLAFAATHDVEALIVDPDGRTSVTEGMKGYL